MSTDTAVPAHSFSITDVADDEWLIHDRRYPFDDSRCVVAYVQAAPDQSSVTVAWIRATGLAWRFATVDDALAELARWEARSREPSGRPPFRIPSFPPRR